MKMKLRAILERLAIVALPLIAMLCVAIPAFAADSKTNSMDVNLEQIKITEGQIRITSFPD